MNINLTEATIAKLDLQPDDVIVLRVTDPNWKLKASDAADMRKRVREIVGDHEVIVLAYGLDLEIVRPDEVPA